MIFKNKKILIFGLGRFKEGSGVSAARFFVNQGARVVVTDKKIAAELGETVKMLQGKVRFSLGGHKMSDLRGVNLVVRNPGVPNSSPYIKAARARGIPIVTDISLFLELTPCPVLGITGTRGKSTTTALVGKMLEQVNKKTFVGGNIQRSPLAFINKINEDSIVVLELSSWMLESLADISRSPWGAIVTNVYPDHLNVHESMEEYVAAKEQIFKHQQSGDILVLNYDSVRVREMARRAGRGVVVRWFSFKPLPKSAPGVCVKNNWVLVFGKRLMPISKIKIQGQHNLANALAATALAYEVGVPIQKIINTLKSFEGLANRQEMVRVYRGVSWINDTTATSPEAAMAALERFSKKGSSKRIVLIAGGVDKKFTDVQFKLFSQAIKRYCKAVVLFSGSATDKLIKKLLITDYQLPVTKNMREAISEAQKIARPGDLVLLSPGAASFGLFKNEFDRGEQFVKSVNQLK